jgi:hypothetical protein
MIYEDEIIHHETKFGNFNEAIAKVQFSDGDLQAMKSILENAIVPYAEDMWAKSFLKYIEETLAKKSG